MTWVPPPKMGILRCAESCSHTYKVNHKGKKWGDAYCCSPFIRLSLNRCCWCSLTAARTHHSCTTVTGMALQYETSGQSCLRCETTNSASTGSVQVCMQRQVIGARSKNACHLRAGRRTYPSDFRCCGEAASCSHQASGATVCEDGAAPQCEPANQWASFPQLLTKCTAIISTHVVGSLTAVDNFPSRSHAG
jgi:hypothetical protein